MGQKYGHSDSVHFTVIWFAHVVKIFFFFFECLRVCLGLCRLGGRGHFFAAFLYFLDKKKVKGRNKKRLVVGGGKGSLLLLQENSAAKGGKKGLRHTHRVLSEQKPFPERLVTRGEDLRCVGQASTKKTPTTEFSKSMVYPLGIEERLPFG